MMKKLLLVEKQPTSLAALSKDFRSGKQSPFDYLTRLEHVFDEREPHIQAFVPQPQNPFDRLRKELDVLMAKYPDASARPALFGIPIGVKDIFHVDGFQTRAGSKLPPDAIGGAEAAVVKKLKTAGALILGKTVTVEFANYSPGPTRNPHNPAHTPGGSSSGSAAAVAAGLCPLALGTQTVGSVIRPAAFCGIVGVKPTYGRVSVDGVIPLAPTLDHVGFFTADIEGASLAASILIDDWKPTPGQEPIICGVPQGPYLEKASHQGLQHFHQTCEILVEAGIQVKYIDMLDNFEEITANHDNLCEAEFAIVHGEWFQKFSEIYSEGNREAILRGQKIDSDTIERCRAHREMLRNDLQQVMARHHLTALLAPAAPGPAPRGLDSTGDWIMNLPWTQPGLPVVTVPSGLSKENLPFGLQIVGRWMEDELLLNVAKNLAALLNY
jgi:Asp-tRNA(Asn)/Glu-tRNA(Gln) amidotransferase A subunit family amidase